jgi:hypothetical protein
MKIVVGFFVMLILKCWVVCVEMHSQREEEQNEGTLLNHITAILSEARSQHAATSSGELAFFAGGYNATGQSNVRVDILNDWSGSQRTTTLLLSQSRSQLATNSSKSNTLSTRNLKTVQQCGSCQARYECCNGIYCPSGQCCNGTTCCAPPPLTPVPPPLPPSSPIPPSSPPLTPSSPFTSPISLSTPLTSTLHNHNNTKHIELSTNKHNR